MVALFAVEVGVDAGTLRGVVVLEDGVGAVPVAVSVVPKGVEERREFGGFRSRERAQVSGSPGLIIGSGRRLWQRAGRATQSLYGGNPGRLQTSSRTGLGFRTQIDKVLPMIAASNKKRILMNTLENGRKPAATRLAAPEVDFHRERVTAMYQRSWTAQQKATASGASGSTFADFVRAAASPFGVHTETQSASDAGLWHRDRLRDITKLPKIGDMHRYATGESRKVLFVVFERNRLRVLTD